MTRRSRNYFTLITLMKLGLVLTACGDYISTPTLSRPNITGQATANLTINPTESSPPSPTIQVGPPPQNVSVPQPGHLTSVYKVTYSPDGKILASGSLDGQIKLWQPATGQLLATLAGHISNITDLAFSPNGKMLASSSEDKTVKLWDATTFKELATLKGHTTDVERVAFAPDGKTLASVSYKGAAKLWDVATWREKANLADAIEPVAFSPDGKWLVTGFLASNGARGDTLKIWDIATNQPSASLQINGQSGVSSLIFRKDGQVLAVGSGPGGYGPRGNLTLWDISQGFAAARIIFDLANDQYGFSSFAFSPDGKTIIASGEKGVSVDRAESNGVPLAIAPVIDQMNFNDTLRLIDATTGKIVTSGNFLPYQITRPAFNPDGQSFATGSDDGAVIIWRPTDLNQPSLIIPAAPSPVDLAFSPDGKICAAAGLDGNIRLSDPATGNLLATLSGHKKAVQTIAFSPDGKLLASGGKDDSLLLWDVTSHKLLGSWKEHFSWVNALDFSPDGKLLASGSSDTTVRLWDVTKPGSAALVVWQTQPNAVWTLAFSPDGKTLASGSDTQAQSGEGVRFWDVATRQKINSPLHVDVGVRKIAFAPDNKTLAVLTQDNMIKSWDVITGKLIATFKNPAVAENIYRIQTNNSLQYLQNGQVLIAALPGVDTLESWDTTTRRELFNLQNTNPLIFRDLRAVAFSLDGQNVALGYGDASIKFMRLATP